MILDTALAAVFFGEPEAARYTQSFMMRSAASSAPGTSSNSPSS